MQIVRVQDLQKAVAVGELSGSSQLSPGVQLAEMFAVPGRRRLDLLLRAGGQEHPHVERHHSLTSGRSANANTVRKDAPSLAW